MLKLFDKVPPEIMIEVCSHASSKDLFTQYRFVNKAFEKAAIIALCLRQDKLSIYYQSKLFQINLRPSLLNDESFKKTVQINIKKNMQSLNSSLLHKLGVLLFIARLKDISISIPDTLMHALQALVFTEPTKLICHFYFLASHMTPMQINRLITAVKTRLENNDSLVRWTSLLLLTRFMPQVNKAQQHDIITAITTKLNDEDTFVRQETQIILSTLTSNTDKIHVTDMHIYKRLLEGHPTCSTNTFEQHLLELNDDIYAALELSNLSQTPPHANVI